MPTYTAPVKDMQFLLHDLLKISEADIPGYSDLDRSFTEAILDEAAKVSQEILTPLNVVGDAMRGALAQRLLDASAEFPRPPGAGLGKSFD